MSQLLINQYFNEIAKLKQISGTSRESVVREAFKDLLKKWARSHDLYFVPEQQIETKTKDRRYVDGALLHALRVPFGYWEAKDSNDDLDREIDKKFRAGYPKTNIIFEDSQQAVLIQHGEEVIRCQIDEAEKLEKLLNLFFAYEQPATEAFRKAVEQFKVDLPAVLDALREMIDTAYEKVPKFRSAADEFLEKSREAINPNVTEADVREMLIQHVLTGGVFAAVFPSTTYHQDNSVARELHKLEETFFTGNTRHQALKGLAPYYTAIRKAAAEVNTHHEKQNFLKAIYENFYKVYNPKAADRLGVVYTPNEIVRFMIESTDWLCEKHFGRNLIDENVHILDPATGTGTFICEILEHFRGQPKKLQYKYNSELHANELAILPYYVANLNIEATYAAITDRYEEFTGLCLVDTLDNTHALKKHKGHMGDMFGAMSDDNVKRIKRQNEQRISVIIGNPPYNANQLNENENNKNRPYPVIDKRLKATYIKASTAQKTKLYDMYARFFRWASDRLDENGVLAFISNRSFIESRTFDGFRKLVAEEFSEIHVVDLGGDVRINPKLSGTKHNVFGIQTGVAISFMVRRAKGQGCRIFYARRPELETAEDKLSFLGNTKIKDASFKEIQPDAKHNWINLADNDFGTFLPVASKETKAAKNKAQEKAIFKFFSLGLSTNRDEWVIDIFDSALSKKMNYFISRYNNLLKAQGDHETDIKWSETLKRRFNSGQKEPFGKTKMIRFLYRPYFKEFIYNSNLFIDRPGAFDEIFPPNSKNKTIMVSGAPAGKPFQALSVDTLASLDLLEKTKVLPLYRFVNGHKTDNITDWALEQFKNHYKTKGTKKARPITKESIFHYVYAVLHDPVYREKYALNLKRDFPHIPFYPDFHQWAGWGRELMELHIGYESVKPFPLKRRDKVDEQARNAGLDPKCFLSADKETGTIHLDSETILYGIPETAWRYKLGNRSALEWVLDQYKEKKPKDPTIREKFNTYRFADYKEQVIDLLARVATVSIQTEEITEAMKKVPRN